MSLQHAMISPYDLSGSMNMIGQVTSEPVRSSIAKMKKQCYKKFVPVGMVVMKAEDAQKEINDEYKFIVGGIDSVLLWNAAKTPLIRCLRGHVNRGCSISLPPSPLAQALSSPLGA